VLSGVGELLLSDTPGADGVENRTGKILLQRRLAFLPGPSLWKLRSGIVAIIRP